MVISAIKLISKIFANRPTQRNGLQAQVLDLITWERFYRDGSSLRQSRCNRSHSAIWLLGSFPCQPVLETL